MTNDVKIPGAAAAPRASTRTPVWGTPQDRAGAVRASIGATLAVAVYVAVARAWFPESAPTGVEIFGTATSLSCVWLTRRQNVWSMPIGLVSVLAMGSFFFDIGLVGQGWLHLGFYVPISFVGWWVWLRGGDDGGELPVRRLTVTSRVVGFIGLAALCWVLVEIFAAVHGPSPYLWWDTSIVAASIGAQLLLTAKRVESYVLWLIPVNISAVALYVISGAYLFAALYGLYIATATSGLIEWHRSERRSAAGADAVTARTAT